MLIKDKKFRVGFVFGMAFGFVFGAMLMIALVAFSPEVKASELPPTSEQVVDCPEGHKCIPDEIAERWLPILEERQCMDTALDELNEDLQLEFSEYHVIITREGQVFDREQMEIVLTWCNYEIGFLAAPNLSISIAEEEDDVQKWGFRLRLRLGAAMWPKAFLDLDQDVLSPVFMVEPFFISHFHALAYAGLDNFGVGLGLDLTRNLNVFGGVGATWSFDEQDIGPVFGVSLSFN